jgi:hypothetical protein
MQTVSALLSRVSFNNGIGPGDPDRKPDNLSGKRVIKRLKVCCPDNNPDSVSIVRVL